MSCSGTETKALPSSFYGPPGDKTVPVVLAFTGPYSILTLESVNSVHTIMVLKKKPEIDLNRAGSKKMYLNKYCGMMAILAISE